MTLASAVQLAPEASDELRKSISAPRFRTYEGATATARDALLLYAWNARASAAFYVSLQGLEVTLRNAFHREMGAKFGEDWLTASRSSLLAEQRRLVDEALTQLQKLGRGQGPDDVVAALSLGFWLSLLTKSYETLWRQALYRVFSNAKAVTGRGLNRPDALDKLNHIRVLRNRIAHHEPIFQRHLEADAKSISDVIRWMSPETADWYSSISDLSAVLVERPARG
ncbi:MAG: Abi family protein [Myxococcales bacterium]|nr:Abi family protein [Myxococcales bacterium]